MDCNDRDLKITAGLFSIEGIPTNIKPVGSGHINDTYLVECSDAAERYILQRINSNVFNSPDDLMENIANVTEHIRKKGNKASLRIIPALDGSLYSESNGSYWRMMNYIDNSYTCEKAEELRQFREIGRAYGSFISDLIGFPMEKLHVTIDHFHDTRWRFEQLMNACREDPAGRKKSALDEIGFALEHEKDVDILNDCVLKGELPVRVTHNDTRINNVMLDRDTGRALCVIDLDTVMPGLAVNDFGDAIRSGASTGRSDDINGESIRLDLDLYRSFTNGFIEGFPEITPSECRLLPMGARIMTLECGIRFLTDYLKGNQYFKTEYPEHNLMRCRAQFHLLKDIENKWEQMQIPETLLPVCKGE